MASDLNNINIVGRLTKDAELKFTNSGFQITTMSLASNRSVKKQDQWIEEASFFDLKLLGNRGESLAQYLTKGTQLAVNGEIVQERWEQEGQKRSKIVIMVNNIQLLGGNKDNSNGGNQSSYQKPQQNNSYQNNKPSHENYPKNNDPSNGHDFSDDIPF